VADRNRTVAQIYDGGGIWFTRQQLQLIMGIKSARSFFEIQDAGDLNHIQILYYRNRNHYSAIDVMRGLFPDAPIEELRQLALEATIKTNAILAKQKENMSKAS